MANESRCEMTSLQQTQTNEIAPMNRDSLPMANTSLLEVFDPEATFEARITQWAKACRLYADSSECPGAAIYIRTAYKLFSDMDTREAVAKYMLLVAMGDIILDKRLEGETPEMHRARLVTSVDYLRKALVVGAERIPLPDVVGTKILETITQQWHLLLWQYASLAAPVICAQWYRALDAHYDASVREWSAEVIDNVLIRALCEAPEKKRLTMSSIRMHYGNAAHPAITSRIEDLLRACSVSASMEDPALLELRLWLYLLDVNTIGAGLAFRTAALTVPEAHIPALGLETFEETLPLLDMRIRLANDASGFFEGKGEDRDEGKINSCALLLAKNNRGELSAAARNRAAHLFHNVCARLDAVLDSEITDLNRHWPEMGLAVVRGRKLGVRVYEVSHYTTLDREAFASLSTSLLEAS
jgi:hypothetical protein